MPEPPQPSSAARGSSPAEATAERAQARALRVLLRTFLLLIAGITALGALSGSWDRAAAAALGGAVYGLLLLGLDRLGTRRAAALSVVWTFVVAAASMALGRGIYDVTMVLFPAGLLLGALFLRREQLTALTAATVVVVAAVGAWELLRGVAAAPADPSAVDVVVASLLLLVSGVVARLVVQALQETVAETRRAEDALAAANRKLALRNEALQLVNDLSRRLQRGLDLDAIAGEAIDVLVRHSRPPLVALYLLEEDGESLRLVADCGFTAEERRRAAVLPVDGSISGLAVREQRPISSVDVGSDPRVSPEVGPALAERGLVSALAIPLAFGTGSLGTVNLVFTERRDFTPLDLDTYQSIGQAVAMAITNSRHVAGLEFQAFHDPLTALPNRDGLHRRLRTVLSQRRRASDRVALVLVDVNRFREINEALGHHVGDELLVQVAARLERHHHVPKAEVFRLGGDEFAVLLEDPRSTPDAEAQARGILASLGDPFEAGGLALEVAATAGLALAPDHGTDSHELLRCADVALARAKSLGGGVVSYAREIDERTPDRLALMSELGRAIREGSLVLHFQPQVSLRDGWISGCEALARWPHPKMGLLDAGGFVPEAEASDVMNPLTYWVVEAALGQLARWTPILPRLTMAMNLSVRNLLDRNCPQRLEEIVRRVGVDPGRVELEVTETALMTDPEAAVRALGRITEIGVRLAIDDFGTGYSSLSYLKRFPVQVLKIDRSFVSEMVSREKSRAIVRSTVQLAHSIGLVVVAEGIEDLATAEALREIDCDLAQGYFFSRPEPADVIERRMRRGERLPGFPSGSFSLPA